MPNSRANRRIGSHRTLCLRGNRRRIGEVASAVLAYLGRILAYLIVARHDVSRNAGSCIPTPPRRAGRLETDLARARRRLRSNRPTARSCTAGSCRTPNPKRAILYCHGNGEHVAFNAELAAHLRDALQASVFLFDYRGYGHSEGRPSEAGCIADGRAAQHWLANRMGIKPSDVVLMGRSLGGAVAVALAGEEGAAGLGARKRVSHDARRRRASLPVAARSLGDEEPLRLFVADQALQWPAAPKPRRRPTRWSRSPLPGGCSTRSPSYDKKWLEFADLGHNGAWPPQLLRRAGGVSRRRADPAYDASRPQLTT